MANISVLNTDITVLNYNHHDYISLTDMASAKEGDNRAADIIKNWIRNRYTIEFLGTWETIHNPGLPSFVLNAVFIQDGIPQREWLIRLNRIAIQQMQVLEDMTGRKLLK